MSVYSDFQKFVADLEKSTTFKTWCTHNGGDCSIWETYRTAVLNNTPPPGPPAMSTIFGKSLVDVGIMAIDAGLVAPPPPPPPPPPPGSQSLGTYLDPAAGGGVNYAAEWDAAKAAMPYLSFAMSPMDSSVITHIGTNGQCVLVFNGSSTANFLAFGKPCWDTGMVDTFVIWDEPGTGDIAAATTMANYVKAVCTGTNNLGHTVKTAITHYDPAFLATLAADHIVDVLINDNYPSRSGWNLVQWSQCVAACEAALSGAEISEFWIVLDAFEAPSYPAPTPAQLLTQIGKAQASNAARLVVYAWGQAGGIPLASLGLIPTINTIH